MNAPVQTAEAREIALAGMGVSRLRKEDARFIQGKGNYVDDIKMPGMLHMDIVRSPIAHGRIVKINKAAALAIDHFGFTDQNPVYKGLDCFAVALPIGGA
mgnify:CR=1 FL=1